MTLALCDGKFNDETVLHIKDSKTKPPVSFDKNIKVYDITLLNTDISESDTVSLRILNENKDKTTAWCLTDGKWEKIKTTSRGKYTVLQTVGTKNTICLKYEKRTIRYISIISGALGTLFFSAAIIFFIKRKKRYSIK